MATIADLLVKISADTSQLRKELEASQRQLKRTFGSQALGLSKKFLLGITGLGTGMVGLGVASIKLAGDMQATEKSFEVLLGNAESAKKMMANLINFASTTPFSLSGLSDAARQLLAFGYQAKDVTPILQAAGDAAALMGKGTVGVNQITLALSQMLAKGKMAGQEMLQLANAGINGYKYVAEAMNLTEQQARAKISKGQIDVGQGLTAIVKGMQSEFAGGMQSLSQEIPGMWATIKDNVNLSLVAIGKKLIETFNIKDKLASAMTWLQKFSASLNEVGVAAAFVANTSDEMQMAIAAVAGAIIGIAIPAFVALGTAIWVAMAPLLPFIALATSFAVLGMYIYQNWNKGFKYIKVAAAYLFGSLKYTFNQIYSYVLKVEKGFYQLKRAIAGVFDSAAADKATAKIIELENELANIADKNKQIAADFNKTWADAFPVDKAKEFLQLMGGIAGLTKSVVAGAIGGASLGLDPKVFYYNASYAAQKGIAAAQKAAEDSWHIESKGSSVDDKDDKGKAARKLAQEIKDALDAVKQLNASWRTLMTDIQRGSLTGAELFKFDQQNQLATTINKLKDDFTDLTERFNSSTDRQKEIYRKWLDEMGIMYAETQKGLLDLTDERLKREEELTRNHYAQVERDERANKAILAEIDAAKYEGDLARLIEYLDAEKAARLAHLEGVQELMDVYTEARKAQMMDEYALMASVYSEFYSGLSSAMSDVIMQTQTAAEAFKSLGKSMIKVVVDFIAQKVMGLITSTAMAILLGKKQTAASVADAAIIAAAWAPAAAMVSLATQGANSAPAMAGITATVILANSLAAVPGLAKGGIVTGPTTALIGEGRYNEAVLPLNKQYLERVGLVQDNAPTVNAVQNNYGDINTDVDFDDLQAAFGSMLQSALKVA